MLDDLKAVLRQFEVDPSWYREYWFGDDELASPISDRGETNWRPPLLDRIPGLIGSLLAAAAAGLHRGGVGRFEPAVPASREDGEGREPLSRPINAWIASLSKFPGD